MSIKIDWEEIYTKGDLFYSKKTDKVLEGEVNSLVPISIDEIGDYHEMTTLNFKKGVLNGLFEIKTTLFLSNSEVTLVKGNFEDGIGFLTEFDLEGSIKSNGEYSVWIYPFEVKEGWVVRNNETIKQRKHFRLVLHGKHVFLSNEESFKKITEPIYYYEEDLLKISIYESNKLKRVYTERKRDGSYQGIDLEFHENGKIKNEQYYNNDNIHGQSKKYFENGSIKEEGSYYQGKKDGRWTEYYNSNFINSSNQIKEEGYYKQGYETSVGFGQRKKEVKDGFWKYFDEDGNLIKKEKWSNGRLDGRQFEKLEDGSDFYSIYRNGEYIGKDNIFSRIKYILGILIYSDFFDQ